MITQETPSQRFITAIERAFALLSSQYLEAKRGLRNGIRQWALYLV
jgi:hypothetical protein